MCMGTGRYNALPITSRQNSLTQPAEATTATTTPQNGRHCSPFQTQASQLSHCDFWNTR